MSKKIIVYFLFLSIASICIIIFGIFIGAVNFTISDIYYVLINKIFNLNNNNISITIQNIILNIRLPRVLLAFLVGSALSLSGVIIQSVLQNPLASPYTLGVSSGVSLFVSIMMVMNITVPFLGIYFTPLTGLIGGIIVVFLVIKTASMSDLSLSSFNIVLFGMIFSLFFSSIQNLILSIYKNDIVNIVSWQLGTFSSKGFSYILSLIPFLTIGICLSLIYSKEMDILSLGKHEALSSGVDYDKTSKILIFASVILSASCIAISGIIGFVDLIIPHISRKIFGSKHIYIIPASILIGGCFMVFVDIVSRSLVPPKELSLSIITSLIGSPFFAYVYLSRRTH